MAVFQARPVLAHGTHKAGHEAHTEEKALGDNRLFSLGTAFTVAQKTSGSNLRTRLTAP